jgi:ribosomal protein S27AE
MTIRDYIERRRNLIFISMGVSMVAVAVLLYINERLRLGIDSMYVTAGLFAVPVGALIIKQRIQCPACGKPVGWLSTRSADGQPIKDARCPNCGVSIDQPMPPAP